MSAMVSWHKPGQRVVCVRACQTISLHGGPLRPGVDVGRLYTISEVLLAKDILQLPDKVLADVVGFLLAEKRADEWYVASLFASVIDTICINLFPNKISISI